MDFNLDDPLGDLLSDNSNDSFFESGPKKGSTTPAKPASIKSGISGSAKTKIEDLFGIQDVENALPLKKQETVVKPPDPPPPLKVAEPLKVGGPNKNRVPIQKAASVFNDDDLISDLGFDPKKPKSFKASILDDLLGPMEPKKGSSTALARPLTAGGVPKDDLKPISRQSTETTESTAPGTYTTSLPRPKTAGRRPSITSANDPLGFFGPVASAKDKESVEARDTKSTPKVTRKSSPADWLGLDSDKKPSQKEASRPASPAPPPYQKESEPQILTIPDPVGQSTFSLSQVPSNPSGAMLMAAATMETQNMFQTLQQQESQISIVTQLKNQEFALQDIHKRQQDLLSQQEAKFNQMLQQQIHRQNQLETAIKSQQDRINAYMQLAMTSGAPVSTQVSTTRPRGTLTGDEPDEPEMDEIQLKAEVKRLELEKLRLEDLNANINANHEKEMEFMDNSYRKQIKLLETNLQSLETRLQNELQSLEEFYNKKLKLLETENGSITSAFEQKIKALQDEHESIIKKLKSAHDADVALLKEDFRKTIENIRESRLLEFAVVQEHSSYLSTLRTASNYLENVSGDLQTLKDELYRKVDLEHQERLAKLNLREKKLEDAEAKIKIIEETYEGDKTRLMELVTSLEIQMGKLSQDRSEEQWTMRQKLASLEAERSTLEREKLIVREQLKRDEKRIEELKQLQIEESQRIRDRLEEERQSFFAEKAKFETSKRLQSTTNQVQTAQAELESALKVAQDAIKQTDQERDRYLQMQRHLEAKKRELVDQENIARQKQDELESAVLNVKAKERRLEEEHRKHRIAMQNLNANTQLLHTQMRQVAEREARLSQDWVTLLNERSEFQNLKRKLENNKCSLCRIGERSEELSKILANTNSEIPTRNVYNVNTARNNLHQDNIDTLLGEDVAHSLKKMATSTMPANLATDLDINMSLIPNFRMLNEPSNLALSNDMIESEVINLNFGSGNFNDE